MWYRYQPVLIIQLVVVVGSKEHRLSLDHLLGQQQKDPSDYVSSQTWSIFNVFGSDSQSDFDKAAGPSEKTERGELSSPSLPPGPQPGKLGKSRGGTSNGRKGGQARANASPAKLKPNRPEEEWLKIIEDELPAAGAAATDDKHASKNNTSSRPHNDLQGSKRAKASGFLPAPKSAASTGGLLPTRVYVINSDSAVERWVQFRGRWSIVHRLSETFHNESAASSEDTPLNPVRFRAADLRPKQSASRAGASSASSSAASSFGSNEKVAWTRRLDVLPPRARRAAFECQEQAQRRGGGDGGYLDALSYSLSHLALWESLAMDRSLKKDDRVLILDDSARPRQRWREILARHAAAVPKDWDILALGW